MVRKVIRRDEQSMGIAEEAKINDEVHQNATKIFQITEV